LGISTQLGHTQLRQLFADDLLVFVSVAIGELGTPGQGHIHGTVPQHNVRSNLLLKARLGNVVIHKRVGLVCSSESAAQGSLPAIPSYQRRSSSPRKREENVTFPTNLHGVRRSARPTSR